MARKSRLSCSAENVRNISMHISALPKFLSFQDLGLVLLAELPWVIPRHHCFILLIPAAKPANTCFQWEFQDL